MIDFLIFILLQAIFINGVKMSTEKDMIFEPEAKWIAEKLGWWSKPIVGCIKCQSSFWGFITYWPFALEHYGFFWWSIPVFVADVFILVFLNYFFYKRL